jgi:hypothetical protein
VAVFRDLVQLIQVLPGKAAANFRLKCANYLCRLLSGDTTLIPQILATAASVPEAVREVVMQDVPTAAVEMSSAEKRCREGHMILDLQERNFNFQVKRIKMIKEICGEFDDRDRIYYKDLLKKSDDPGYAVIQDTVDPRGREISIQLVAQELGINPRSNGPMIGRLMAKRWREAHPNEEIPKRDTLYQGKPYKENTYYQCDYDMLAACIREICDK